MWVVNHRSFITGSRKHCRILSEKIEWCVYFIRYVIWDNKRWTVQLWEPRVSELPRLSKSKLYPAFPSFRLKTCVSEIESRKRISLLEKGLTDTFSLDYESCHLKSKVHPAFPAFRSKTCLKQMQNVTLNCGVAITVMNCTQNRKAFDKSFQYFLISLVTSVINLRIKPLQVKLTTSL